MLRRAKMKKIIACIIISTFLAAALCGCGSNNDAKDDHAHTDKPVETATVTPDMSMDVDDGIVNDRDGVIDDDYTPGDAQGAAGTNNGTSGSGTAGTANGGSASPAVPTQTDKP